MKRYLAIRYRAEIGATDQVAVADRGRRAAADHGAVLQHIGMVGDLQRALDHLLDQQDGGPGLAQALQHLHHLIDDDGRQAERRLVEHQKLGLAHQRLGDRQHLLLAARQDAGQRLRPLGQHGKQLVDEIVALPLHGLVETRAVEAELQVGVHVLAAEQAASLGDMQQPEIDDAVRRLAGNVGSREDDAARRRPQQPRDRPQKRALARAVAADQRHDRALLDREVDAAQHADMAIADIEAAHLQEAGGAHEAACPTCVCEPM